MKQTKTKTPGQRLAEECSCFTWDKLNDSDRETFEAKAVRLGIQPHEIEVTTPSYGELFERAMLSTRVDCGKAITHRYEESAAEFMRLVKEYYGEPPEESCHHEDPENSGNCISCGLEREEWHWDDAGTGEPIGRKRSRDGEPLPVTNQQG